MKMSVKKKRKLALMPWHGIGIFFLNMVSTFTLPMFLVLIESFICQLYYYNCEPMEVFNRNTSIVLNNVKHYHLDIGANEAIIKQ